MFSSVEIVKEENNISFENFLSIMSVLVKDPKLQKASNLSNKSGKVKKRKKSKVKAESKDKTSAKLPQNPEDYSSNWKKLMNQIGSR